jgi:hypothetical protein
VYLYLALFWLGVGIILQVFWESISTLAHIPVDRMAVGLFCFILMTYNFTRWRIGQIMKRAEQKVRELPPHARREPVEYDPNLDFTHLDDDQSPPKPKE